MGENRRNLWGICMRLDIFNNEWDWRNDDLEGETVTYPPKFTQISRKAQQNTKTFISTFCSFQAYHKK